MTIGELCNRDTFIVQKEEKILEAALAAADEIDASVVNDLSFAPNDYRPIEPPESP